MPEGGEIAAMCSCEPDLENGVGLLGLVVFFPLSGHSAKSVPPVVGCVILHKFLRVFGFFSPFLCCVPELLWFLNSGLTYLSVPFN